MQSMTGLTMAFPAGFHWHPKGLVVLRCSICKNSGCCRSGAMRRQETTDAAGEYKEEPVGMKLEASPLEMSPNHTIISVNAQCTAGYFKPQTPEQSNVDTVAAASSQE